MAEDIICALSFIWDDKVSRARLKVPGGDRIIIADHVPLDKPLCIRDELAPVCTFAVNFVDSFKEYNNYGFLSFGGYENELRILGNFLSSDK